MAAGVVAAALGPADEREGLQPALAQPAALLAGGEVDVGVCPLPRPVVLGPVEARGAEPVLQRQLVAVADAQPALFGAVDEEQPAERPERLTADVGGVLLVDDQDPTAPFDQLTGGDQTGEPRSDHDDISICHGRQCSGSVRRRPSAPDTAATGRRGRAPMHQRQVDRRRASPAAVPGVRSCRAATRDPDDADAPRGALGRQHQRAAPPRLGQRSPRRCRAPGPAPSS